MIPGKGLRLAPMITQKQVDIPLSSLYPPILTVIKTSTYSLVVLSKRVIRGVQAIWLSPIQISPRLLYPCKWRDNYPVGMLRINLRGLNDDE